jgi:hypothetical protein
MRPQTAIMAADTAPSRQVREATRSDTSRADEKESPEAETWRYLERLEQRAQMRKIRRTQETVPQGDGE